MTGTESEAKRQEAVKALRSAHVALLACAKEHEDLKQFGYEVADVLERFVARAELLAATHREQS